MIYHSIFREVRAHCVCAYTLNC